MLKYAPQPTLSQDPPPYKISKPKDSIVYKQIGELYPSVNYAHIRIKVDLHDVGQVAENICSLVNTVNK